MRKSAFILLFVIAILSNNYASLYSGKNDSIKYFIEARLHYGFVISHHKSMAHLTTGHFPAFEINVGQQTHGEQVWQPLYKYPIIGMTFWYADLANPEVLGSAFAIYPYLNFHLYQQHDFLFNFRFGTGLGYLTKKFDRLDNYKNIAIGSHINVTLNLFYEFKWIVLKKFAVSCFIGLTHFSNGAFKTPNLGINIPTIGIGVSHISHTSHHIITRIDTASFKKTHNLKIQLFISAGMKQMYPADGNTYGAYSLSSCFLKPLSKKREIGAGLDLFWEFANISNLKGEGIEVAHDYEVIKPGLHIDHQFDFSRFSFATQLGFYLYAKDKSDGPVYSRFALRYKITNKVMLNLALKTHFAKADFVEWGIGYSLK
jgi:hypothetical protein